MIDRTQLIALILMLRLRLTVLVFALSWAVWWGRYSAVGWRCGGWD